MLTIKNSIVHNATDNDELQELVKVLEQEPNFLDHSFPSNVQSLVGGVAPSGYGGEWNAVKWKRLAAVYLGKLTLCVEVEPSRLRFGRVEARNVLNVLGVLACRRELVDRIVEVREAKSNVLAVWLFMDGRWRLTVVDSLLPAYGTTVSSRLVFSCTEGSDAWASVLEKAYAKALGSYYRLLAPNAAATLQHFTGLPIEKVPMYELKELWTRLKEHLRRGNLLVASLTDEDGYERLFTLANFCEHPTAKLLKVRNGYT